jgi:hypothetical protein
MKKYLLLVPMFLACAGMALAQSGTGSIFGQVTDSSSALMPGVKVTLSGPALLQPMVVTTSDAGSYQFPNIPVGLYSVQFELSGYRTFLRENIRIDIGFNAQINAQMEVSTVQQSVEVSGAAPVIDTQSTAESSELDQQSLTELPVARSYYNEVELSGGANESAKDVGGAQNLNQPSFVALGDNSGQNRYFYDGADIGPSGMSNAMWVDFNSVQEMQVLDGGADASVQTSGMSINMVVKSGSDKLHGSFHDFEEGQTFESNNFNAATRLALAPAGTSAGNPLTHFRDIGGEVGGPAIKGRLWYWGDYGYNGVWVGADKVYQTTPGCSAVAANQLGYSWSTVRSCLFSFPTLLKYLVYKVGWQPFQHNTFTFTNEYSNKEVLYNGLTSLVPLISTRPQNAACGSHFNWGGLGDIAPLYPGAARGLLLWNCGWPALFKWDDQHVINGHWVVDANFIHFAKRNQFALQNENLYFNTAVQLEQASGAITASNAGVVEFQPMNQFQITTNYSLPGKWGGNHTIKVGYNWTRFENWETNNMGGAAEEIFSSGTAAPFSKPLAVNFYRYGYVNQFLRQQNIYVEDTYSHKRWTLNLGIRWDHQTDSEVGLNIAASPYEGQLDMNGIPFSFLPAVNYPGAQGGVAWNTFAPRLGATYDLLGTGKTVLKASFAQYFDQRTSGQLADAYNTIGAGTNQAFVQFPWNGAQANGLPLMSGVNTKTLRTFANNYNPANPANTKSANSVDPNIKDPKTNEVTVGVSQQVAAGFGLTVTYTYRRYTDFIWSRLNGLSSANYVPCQTSPTAAVPCTVVNPNTGVATTTVLPATTCPTTVAPTAPTQCVPVTYYVPNIPLPSAYTLANIPDYHISYQGLQFVARKLMSHNWMFNGSVTIQSTRQFWTAPDAYQDPTNIAQENGAQFAPTSSPGGGFPVSVAVNSRWNSRFGGQYRLPMGFALSAFDDLTQGYPYLSTINVSGRANQAPTVAVLVAPPGTQRFSVSQDVNFRIENNFSIRERLKIVPSLDFYNTFNSFSILGQQPNQNSASANYIEYALSPRVLRLGIVLNF